MNEQLELPNELNGSQGLNDWPWYARVRILQWPQRCSVLDPSRSRIFVVYRWEQRLLRGRASS